MGCGGEEAVVAAGGLTIMIRVVREGLGTAAEEEGTTGTGIVLDAGVEMGIGMPGSD